MTVIMTRHMWAFIKRVSSGLHGSSYIVLDSMRLNETQSFVCIGRPGTDKQTSRLRSFYHYARAATTVKLRVLRSYAEGILLVDACQSRT